VRQPERDARQGGRADLPAQDGGCIDVRELTPGELELVDAHLPLSRLGGEQTYLVAWEGDLPVGHAHVAWANTTLGVPEVQDVFVAESRRRRGIGTELARAAERMAAARGHHRISLSFGLENDGARRLYEGLGYKRAELEPQRIRCTILIRGKPVEIDDTLIYLVKELARMTNLEPLWELRIRAPHVELRLPTDEELDELYAVAETGIHPPEEMPFGVAWTDDLQPGVFAEFHRAAWTEWTPERWTCNLVTFLGGRPIGTQGITAEGFASKREVSTGSWLGAPFQRRGFGTEQRAAVLEFAFRGLGAEAATSGALIDNVASQRVSEKLGYRVTGMSELAPRGEPIPQYDYRLEREDWRCPIPVEIEDLEPCLHLFGAFPRTG
jgi:RimJ/RimL family protein N-acetyltransferase